MKMLALDLETTGLDPKIHGTIQLGGVTFNSGHPVGKFEREVELNLNFENLVWTKFCLNLHKAWIETNLNATLIPQNEALALFFRQLDLDKGEPLVIAGKNPQFDYSFIRMLPDPEGYLSTRRIYLVDPAMNYSTPFDKAPPSLKVCKQRAAEQGCSFASTETAHTALADAIDVMRLIQWKKD
jgi:hypothetical protein